MSRAPTISGREIVFVGGGLVTGGSIRKLPLYYNIINQLLESMNRTTRWPRSSRRSISKTFDQHRLTGGLILIRCLARTSTG